jgi:ubiquinone/menaquinone biosynthesis C-methylase UbiE
MAYYKFDPAKLEKLNDPARFDTLPPEVFWRALGLGARPCALVEIGAGTGLFAAAFAALAPEAVIYAADTSDQMIRWMKANRPEVASRRVVPVKAAETHVPLEDGIADAVYMINLHHELARPAESYAEARRLLTTGGRLLVVDWAPRETPKGPPLAVRATPETLVRMLAGAGFTDIVADTTTLPWHTMVTATR